MKGGSSFNALVRAMKQDLVESGTAAKDPALLYEIDKVMMRCRSGRCDEPPALNKTRCVLAEAPALACACLLV